MVTILWYAQYSFSLFLLPWSAPLTMWGELYLLRISLSQSDCGLLTNTHPKLKQNFSQENLNLAQGCRKEGRHLQLRYLDDSIAGEYL